MARNILSVFLSAFSIQAQPDQQVYVPHVVFLETEVERNHCHIFQGIHERLGLVALHIAEECTYNLFRQSQHPGKPREHVVKYGPDQERPQDPENPFPVERTRFHFSHREKEQSGHHYKKRDGRAQQ